MPPGTERRSHVAATLQRRGSHAPLRAQSDERLLAALRGSEERAFEELVARYHGPLMRMARQYVSSSAIAEEVVQDTWVGVLRGLDRFRGASSLKTWIFSILINQATTRGARERRCIPVSSLHNGPDTASGASSDRFAADGSWAVAPRPFDLPEDRARILELRGRLRAALADLPERQRVVVALRDVEGFSSDEVSELLNVSPQNQRVLLHRGRTRLAAALAAYHADAPDA
jgi:RNA polymerase sigma-70 factor (ECF subfamily)